MDADYIRLLFGYNHWANQLILNQAAELSQEQFAAPMGLSMESIGGVLAHTLGTEVVWLARCRGGSPGSILAQADLPTFAALRDRWQQQDAEQEAYLAKLTDADANARLTYKNTAGREFTSVVGHILAHVVNHGTQFRSEAGVALTQLGHSPGDVDLIFYLRQRGV
jgi:uncharacterized damage-inducible protein DinB